MVRKRKLGPGPTELIKGDDMTGYYGKTDLPNISKKAFADMLGVTEGVFTLGQDQTSSTDGSEKIEWLKFSHNYKTLFVADRNIKRSISWDHLEAKGVVNGLKEIEIDGVKYRVRLIQATNSNPFNEANSWGDNHNKAETNMSEWDQLIENLTPDTSESNWRNIYSWGQEGWKSSYGSRVVRGNISAAYFHTNGSHNAGSSNGWRPVLEVL